ncbi:MAG: hypothetical protein F6K62_10130 [Sphaerospermopsis sp. SIO1G2]|nr:hypothetical protein [Sphaerospermopsis sp. SIO1G2]
MKHYTTLIKLKQQEIDSLKKQMGTLVKQRASFEQQQVQLADNLRQEVELAGTLVDMRGFFGDYSHAIKVQQQTVQEKIDTITKHMDVLSQLMIQLFAEQKKFEIAHQRKLATLAYKEQQAQQQFLDEQAARRHAHPYH